MSSRLGFAARRLENSVNPAVNGCLFRIKEGYDSERRGKGPAYHQICSRDSGTLTPSALTAIRLWETFTLPFKIITSFKTSSIKSLALNLCCSVYDESI